MSHDRTYLIVGTGAQCRYALEIINGSHGAHGVHAVVEFDELTPAAAAQRGYPVLVCHGNPVVKHDYAEAVKAAGGELAGPLVHPRATIARTATVQPGAIVNAGAVVQPSANVGPGVMVHAGTVIDHDTNVRAYTTVAPGAVLCGGIVTGFAVFIGAGATVLPNLIIGEYATVAAGAVVINNVPNGCTVAGVPAVVIREGT